MKGLGGVWRDCNFASTDLEAEDPADDKVWCYPRGDSGFAIGFFDAALEGEFITFLYWTALHPPIVPHVINLCYKSFRFGQSAGVCISLKLV